MSVKLNKTAMIDEYINNNIEMLVNSNKSLEELCEDFNKNNDKKVSFSSFYKSFKQIAKDKGLTKQRTRKSKHQRMLNEVKKDAKNDENKKDNNDKKGLRPVPPEEAKSLLPDSDEETETETHIEDLDNIEKLAMYSNGKRIYGVERLLNEYEAQIFESSQYFPSYYDEYILIVDMHKCFTINSTMYAPIVCILSQTNIYTNEEYNTMFKTSHPKEHNHYTNIIKMKPITYKYQFYVISYRNGYKNIKPFCKTTYSDMHDILELIEYDKYEDIPELSQDNSTARMLERSEKETTTEEYEEEQEEQNEETNEVIVN